MGRTERYRNYIVQTIRRSQSLQSLSLDIENKIIIDRDNDHYQLVSIGWKFQKRIYKCKLHIDIINGKIWIQQDKTKGNVADTLVALGVPRTDIVIAHYSPKMRKNARFAVV